MMIEAITVIESNALEATYLNVPRIDDEKIITTTGFMQSAKNG